MKSVSGINTSREAQVAVSNRLSQSTSGTVSEATAVNNFCSSNASTTSSSTLGNASWNASTRARAIGLVSAIPNPHSTSLPEASGVCRTAPADERRNAGAAPAAPNNIEALTSERRERWFRERDW
jgi:hypothetical protein